jgi:hypothetical protein
VASQVAVAVAVDSAPDNQPPVLEDKPILRFSQVKMVKITPATAEAEAEEVVVGLEATAAQLETVILEHRQDRLGLAVRLPKIRLESTPVGLEISTTQVA